MTYLIEKHWLSFRKMSNVKSFLALKMQGFCKAICKSRHWNLGIGIEIGIGTDITKRYYFQFHVAYGTQT